MNETQRRRRGHNFMPPKAVLRRIPKLYATDGTPAEDKIIRLHYFWANGDCWVAELDPEKNEVYGYTKLAGHDGEWGYTSLEELERLTYSVPFFGRENLRVRLVVERDCHWTPRKFEDIKEAQRS